MKSVITTMITSKLLVLDNIGLWLLLPGVFIKNIHSNKFPDKLINKI